MKLFIRISILKIKKIWIYLMDINLLGINLMKYDKGEALVSCMHMLAAFGSH